jgi:hypothetical protein
VAVDVQGVKLTPSVAIGTFADTNLFNQRSPSGDAAAVLEPALGAGIDWGTARVSLALDARFRRFINQTAQDSNEFGARAAGGLDLAGGILARTAIDFQHAIEPRGTGGGSLIPGNPAYFDDFRSAISANGTGAAEVWRITVAAGERRYSSLRLGDRDVSQQLRDLATLAVEPRLDFALSPDVALFVGGTLSRQRSLNAPFDLRRDATGWRALAGVRANHDDLLLAEVAIGYRSLGYDAPRYRDFGGLTYDARIEWYPTELISARFDARQSLENSAIATVPAVLTHVARLSVFYDPLRNMRVSLSGDLRRERYREIRSEARLASLNLGAEYRFGPALSAVVKASYRQRRSTSALLQGYSGKTASCSLVWSL